VGAWLLLGVDSLIACIAVGPIMDRRWSVLVPFVLLFGVGDGGGYLLGTALHWSYPDNLGFLAPVVVAVIGVYWIAVAIVSKRAAAAEDNPKSRWGIWILPWLLSLDNITYGAVNGVSSHASVWLSALEQAVSSSVQAGIGLAIGIAIASSIPAVRRHLWVANATAGGLMIVGAGALYVLG
jgi:putative Mn2+ efflux pump MntP